ncbi:MAG: hypothetical protein U0Q15_03125 [Kineosporiaceae bacterium]
MARSGKQKVAKTVTRRFHGGVQAGVKAGTSAGHSAGQAASELWEKALPQLEKAVAATETAARTTATVTAAKVVPEVRKIGPGVKKGVAKSLEVAAPKVETAVDKVSPAVDAARDRIVEDLLPRLVSATNTAAAAATASSERALDAAIPGRKAKRRRRALTRIGLVGVLLAAVAAAVTALKRRPRQMWGEVHEMAPATVSALPTVDPAGQGSVHTPDVPVDAVPLVTAPTDGEEEIAVLVDPIPEELATAADDDVAVPPGMEAEADVAAGDVPGVAEREPDPSSNGSPKVKGRG